MALKLWARPVDHYRVTEVKHDFMDLLSEHPDLLAGPVAVPPPEIPEATTVEVEGLENRYWGTDFSDAWTIEDQTAAVPAVSVELPANGRGEVQPVEESETGPLEPATDWYAGLRGDMALTQTAVIPVGEESRGGEGFFAGFESVTGPDLVWRRGDDDVISAAGGPGRARRWPSALKLTRR